MRYALATICIICFLFVDTEWLINISMVEQMAYHHFFHGNIFHLAVNLLTGYFVFKGKSISKVIGSYIIGSLSVLASPTPVIGLSNMIYAMIGIRSPRFNHAWWRHPGTITFLVVTAIMVFIPNISGITHVVSFCGGVAVAILTRFVRQIKNDSAKYI